MTSEDSPSPTPAPRRTALLAVAVAVVATLVAWVRTDPVARGTLWAEDGRVFLADAWTHGLGEALLKPYDGYLHVVPRVLAEFVATVVPVTHAALAVTAASCLVAGVTAALVLVCSGTVTTSTPARLALAGLTVLVPSLPVEVLGNLANVHWFGLWLTPWLLLHRPRTRTGLVGAGVVGLLVGLTEVQALYFVPLVLLGWRDRRGWPARAGLLVGLAAQGVTMLTSPRRAALGDVPELRNVVAGYLADVVLPLWLGTPEVVTAVLRTAGWTVALVALVPSALALLLALRRGAGDLRLAAVVLPAASLVTWGVPVVLNRMPWDWSRPQPGDPVLEMVRYAPVSQMLLASGLVLGATLVGAARWRRAAVGALAALLLVASAVAWRPSTQQRADGPEWADEVPGGREACATPGTEEVALPISPETWVSPVPCEVLGQGG